MGFSALMVSSPTSSSMFLMSMDRSATSRPCATVSIAKREQEKAVRRQVSIPTSIVALSLDPSQIFWLLFDSVMVIAG